VYDSMDGCNQGYEFCLKLCSRSG